MFESINVISSIYNTVMTVHLGMLVGSELLIGLIFWGLLFVFDFVWLLYCLRPVSYVSVFVTFIQSIEHNDRDSRIWRWLAEVRSATRLRAGGCFALLFVNFPF
jgi:hypothetical protein